VTVSGLERPDLETCAQEPIHIPGSIQPRGVLIVVQEPSLTVLQISANSGDGLGIDASAALGEPLAFVIGDIAARTVAHAAQAFGDLRERNPHEMPIRVRGEVTTVDVILHRAGPGLLFVELEVAGGLRPLSFPNTYLAVRGAVAALNRAAGLAELFDLTAHAVRDLTGFDRVMVYRYDAEFNGEVVAEANRADLNSFLGLHYPASDIPAQARALYEKNLIRLISDVSYEASPLIPTLNPATGKPLDLTYSTLRSVSPVHVEYLQNMGVQASMSISLLRDGKLWGLIACHHYAGPHTPPYGVRAAAEFLASTLSLRLLDRFEEETMQAQLTAQSVLAKLTAATLDTAAPLAAAMSGAPDLLDLISADGAVVHANGHTQRRGSLPGPQVIEAIAAWALASGESLVATDSMSTSAPGLDVDPEIVSGALVLILPEDQYVMWLRAEARRAVDWGGDPSNKEIDRREDGTVRLSPRKSFERWRENVRLRSEPWEAHEQALAADLRRHLVEALYARSRMDVRLAETVQRSLLPQMPALAGWELSAHYEPAAGDRIGGDWYDAFLLRDQRLAVVLGDVAGHGVPAAGSMAQLRNALRAYLYEGIPLVDVVTRLNEFADALLPGVFATAVVACIDPLTGAVEAVCAGHPAPFVVSTERGARPVPLAISPPLGVSDAEYEATRFVLDSNESLVFFSDGLIERRGENIGAGSERMRETLGHLTPPLDADRIFELANHDGRDDVTVLTVQRTDAPRL
jgi:chemotaxis family two-component system sensor kinase Cph1